MGDPSRACRPIRDGPRLYHLAEILGSPDGRRGEGDFTAEIAEDAEKKREFIF
jgi:hypothetical protein